MKKINTRVLQALFSLALVKGMHKVSIFRIRGEGGQNACLEGYRSCAVYQVKFGTGFLLIKQESIG